MAPELRERWVELTGGPVRLLEGGCGSAVVLLHGCASASLPVSAEIWGEFARELCRRHRVLALDLPGSGGSPAATAEALTPAAAATAVAAVLGELDVAAAHLVAHDEGALAALALAGEASAAGGPVRSCTLLAPAAIVPAGDSQLNLALLHRPEPRWSRYSLLWTLRRLSGTEAHIDGELLDLLGANAVRGRRAGELRKAAAPALELATLAALSELYARCREGGFAVPVATVWGARDPLSTLERAMLLHSLLGGGPGRASFHAFARCGHFPHRESPRECADLVTNQIEAGASAATSPTAGGTT